MGWKVNSSQGIDEVLREAVQEKIEDETFAAADIKDFMTLFCQLSNNMEDITDEVDGFDRKFVFKIEEYGPIWLSIADAKFEAGEGLLEKPEILLEMSQNLTIDIFTGKADPTQAYMNGDLKVNGLVNDAIKFRTILEIVQEELEV